MRHPRMKRFAEPHRKAEQPNETSRAQELKGTTNLKGRKRGKKKYAEPRNGEVPQTSQEGRAAKIQMRHPRTARFTEPHRQEEQQNPTGQAQELRGLPNLTGRQSSKMKQAGPKN